MNNYLRNLLIFLLLIVPASSFSATTINGRLITSLYGWQAEEAQDGVEKSVDHLRAYQALMCSLRGIGSENISFRTYLRTTDDLRSDVPGDPNTRLYHAYLDWRKIGHLVDLRLGRQFLQAGVGSATMDGVRIAVEKRGFFRLIGYAGSEAPYSRKAEFEGWSENNLWGAYLTSGYIYDLDLGLSYIHKNRDGASYWRQFGITAGKDLSPTLSFFGRLDYDLDGGDLQKLLIRVRYQKGNRLSLYSEFERRKPRIYTGSFFSTFDPKPSSQIRLGSDYRVNGLLRLNGEYRVTAYEDDSSQRVSVAANFGPGSIGFARQTGYGGKSNGIFGGVNYSFGEKLSVGAKLNFSEYELSELVSETERATSSTAQITYIPFRGLETRLELQNLTNPYYDTDLRVLGTIAYSFRYRR